MPPHIYGELTRTIEGCEIIVKRKIVADLLPKAHHLYNVCTEVPLLSYKAPSITADFVGAKATAAASFRELQGTLWALGHIGSNELGCAMILEEDRKFLAWCIENVYSCPYYSLRGTFFYILGLIRRTLQGKRKLLKFGWDCAPRTGNSAVAFPLRASNMFRTIVHGSVAILPNNGNVNIIGGDSLSSKNNGIDTGGTGPPANNKPFAAVSNNNNNNSNGNSNNLSARNINALLTSPVPPPRPVGIAVSPSSPSGGLGGAASPLRLNTLPGTVLNKLQVFQPLSPTKNQELEVLNLIAKV